MSLFGGRKFVLYIDVFVLCLYVECPLSEVPLYHLATGYRYNFLSF